MAGFGRAVNPEDLKGIFGDTEENAQEHRTSPENKEEPNNKATEVFSGGVTSNVKDFFSDDADEHEEPESVGSGSKGSENTQTAQSKVSPSIYSSTAKDFAEQGILTNLSDEELGNIKTADDFIQAMRKSVMSQVEAENKRALDALNYGVKPSEVQQHEQMIRYLDSLKPSQYTGDSKEASELRLNIIYQDLLNRGFEPSEAAEWVQRSVDSGNDEKDVVKALSGNKAFYAKKYNEAIESAKSKQEEVVKKRKSQAESLQKNIMERKDFLGIELDSNTKKKIYDNITNPVHRDTDTGEYYTAVQKFEKDNPELFREMVGFFFTMTDGFKGLGNIINSKVNKVTETKMRNLEESLKGNRTYGNPSYVGGNDSEASDMTGLQYGVRRNY